MELSLENGDRSTYNYLSLNGPIGCALESAGKPFVEESHSVNTPAGVTKIALNVETPGKSTIIVKSDELHEDFDSSIRTLSS